MNWNAVEDMLFNAFANGQTVEGIDGIWESFTEQIENLNIAPPDSVELSSIGTFLMYWNINSNFTQVVELTNDCWVEFQSKG